MTCRTFHHQDSQHFPPVKPAGQTAAWWIAAHHAALWQVLDYLSRNSIIRQKLLKIVGFFLYIILNKYELTCNAEKKPTYSKNLNYSTTNCPLKLKQAQRKHFNGILPCNLTSFGLLVQKLQKCIECSCEILIQSM